MAPELPQRCRRCFRLFRRSRSSDCSGGTSVETPRASAAQQELRGGRAAPEARPRATPWRCGRTASAAFELLASWTRKAGTASLSVSQLSAPELLQRCRRCLRLFRRSPRKEVIMNMRPPKSGSCSKTEHSKNNKNARDSSDPTEVGGFTRLVATGVTPPVATSVTPLAATALAVVAIVCGRRLRESRRNIESMKNRLESIKKHQ